MKYWIVILVLAVILTGGGVFVGLRFTDMAQRIQQIEFEYSSLKSEYRELENNYQALEQGYQGTLRSYTVLQSYYDSLYSDMQELTNRYGALESTYEALEAEHASLSADYDDMKQDFSSLQSTYRLLETEKNQIEQLLREYESVPHSYYDTNLFTKYSNTFDNLSKFLTYDFALPREYEINVFDCSESAAYLEWALENAGFDANIVVGPTPWDTSSGYHAWVIAYTKEYRVAIEATALTGEYNWAYLFVGRIPGVIYGKDELIPSWENYYEGYTDECRNIYLAVKGWNSVGEWNWWEGFWGFN